MKLFCAHRMPWGKKTKTLVHMKKKKIPMAIISNIKYLLCFENLSGTYFKPYWRTRWTGLGSFEILLIKKQRPWTFGCIHLLFYSILYIFDLSSCLDSWVGPSWPNFRIRWTGLVPQTQDHVDHNEGPGELELDLVDQTLGSGELDLVLRHRNKWTIMKDQMDWTRSKEGPGGLDRVYFQPSL